MAVAALSDADFARLGYVARRRASGLAHVEWQDLLHDAIQRALEGTRRWPVAVPFAIFLREVIRSIASEAWRVQVRDRHREVEGVSDELLAEVASEADSPEQDAETRDLIQAIERVFDGDKTALAILAGISAGSSPAEIQAQLL